MVAKKEASPPALSFREGAEDDKKKYLTNLFTSHTDYTLNDLILRMRLNPHSFHHRFSIPWNLQPT